MEGSLLQEGQKKNFFRMLTDTWVMFLGLRFNRKTSERRQLFLNLAPFYVKVSVICHSCTIYILCLCLGWRRISPLYSSRVAVGVGYESSEFCRVSQDGCNNYAFHWCLQVQGSYSDALC